MSLHYCQGNHLKIKVMLNDFKMVTLSTEFFSRSSLICYLQTQLCKPHGNSHVYFTSEEEVMPARAQQELMGDLGLEPAFLGPC